MTKSELIAAMDAHDAEGVRLEKEMTALGLDAKSIKAIRKAETAAAKARATLAELMGEPVVVVAPASTDPSNPSTEPETSGQSASETLAEPKKGAK